MVRLTAKATAAALVTLLSTSHWPTAAHALSAPLSSNSNDTSSSLSSSLASGANSLAVAADGLLGIVPPLLDVVLLKAIYGGQQVFNPPDASSSSSSSSSSTSSASTKTSASSIKMSSSSTSLIRSTSSTSSTSSTPTSTPINAFGGANTGDQSYNAIRAARNAGATWLVPRGQAQPAFNSSSALFSASALARTTAAPIKATYAGKDSKSGNCFPAVGFSMPSSAPAALDGWWCDDSSEYAFMGFSYEVTACQSPSQMLAEFTDARNTFGSRYIRMYGTCDNAGFYDQVIDIAWQVGLGLHTLIWFGFNGDNSYIPRRDAMITALTTNPRAPFVVRALMFGSEPLFDYALPVAQLSAEIVRAQTLLANQSIDVTFSELAYGFQSRTSDGSLDLLKIISPVDIHMLPYFAQDASTGDQAWHDNMNDENYFIQNAPGKKHWWVQNGWPSTHYPGVEPNSPNAVSSVAEEQKYFALLESKCSTFKTMNGNGVGWFYHIYSDAQEPGYGFYDVNGKPKFQPFKPSLFC